MNDVNNLTLYTASQLRKLPKYEWRIEGIVPDVGVVAMYGQSRVGKTFLGLDLACKLTEGEQWFGYPTKKSTVLYAAAESPMGIPQRVRAIEYLRGCELSDRFKASLASLDLSDAFSVATVIKTVKSEGVDTIIFDTFNAVTPSIDENSVRDINGVLQALRKISAECQCLVVVIHHCGYSETHRMRGHSALAAAVDASIYVERSGRFSAWTSKNQREAHDSAKHLFSLKQIEFNGVETCAIEPLSSTPQVPISPTGKNQQLVLRQLREALINCESIHIEDLLERCRAVFDTRPKHFVGAFRKACRGLSDQGFLKIDADLVQLR